MINQIFNMDSKIEINPQFHISEEINYKTKKSIIITGDVLTGKKTFQRKKNKHKYFYILIIIIFILIILISIFIVFVSFKKIKRHKDILKQKLFKQNKIVKKK